MSVQRRFTLPAVATAAALVLSSCGSDSGFESSTPDDTVYCVDENNVVVDESQCNDAAPSSTHHTGSGIGTALMFFMIGRYAGGLRPGTRLDPAQSTQRFRSDDTAARSKAGLSGTVRNGYSASTGKPAGFGSNSKQRSGHSGGFGGGHSGG
ncbi:hypothetical protein [Glutamicibacter sp.]|uniref:hypothetical protein n=1 Tax=Glutamicibacter sp. TaxID=1931995 RepID=UPI0028BF4E8B|nr:hypothetical protein [Glutamicibacter sp.]